jgi:hypothetical protein
MPTGEARISGAETLVPATRQVSVARAYVGGLEADREKLRSLEEQYDKLLWEVVNLASYTRALYLATANMYAMIEGDRKVSEDFMERVEDLLLLDRAGKTYAETYLCECGHSKYDHDEKGCQYLGCAPICGVS